MVKFVDCMKEQLTKIPRHSGNTIEGCQQAISYLRSLENEIKQALRLDFEGQIDEDAIDKMQKDIGDMIFRLGNQIVRIQADKQIIDAALRDL